MPHPRPAGLRYDHRVVEHEEHLPDVPRESLGKPVTLVEGIKFGDLLPTIQAHVNRDYETTQGHTKHSGDSSWRKLPELPSAIEMMTIDSGITPPPLPANNIHTSWESKERYLETHYKLLRADALGPIQEALAAFRDNPDMMDDRNVCVYTQVHIIGYTWANTGAAPRIEFSHMRSGKRIIWKQTKRLQQGTLVVLSPATDRFKSVCKVATVAARPLAGVEQNPPQVDLFWATPDDAEFDPSQEYIMLEARSGYFEASRHMLVAIQKLMTEQFPLHVPLIDSTKDIGIPKYLRDQPLMDFNSLSSAESPSPSDLDNVNVLDVWPTIADSGLDQSQLNALKRILTKKVAVVQGPPGTGKTFVSVCALKIMLNNWISGDPPIIIAAQTNHALDQLLDYVKDTDPDFLRIGGRTDKDNEDIVRRTLYEVRQAAPKEAQAPKQNFHNTRKALEDQGTRIGEVITKALAQNTDEVDLLLKHEFLTRDQVESLSDEDWIDGTTGSTSQSKIRSWLGPGQIALSSGCPPMKLGFLEEEIDLDYEDLNEREIEDRKAHETDDIDTLRGKWFPVMEDFVGRSNESYQEGRVRTYLKKCRDMYKIPIGARGDVYRYLRTQLKAVMIDTFRQHLHSYERVARNLKISKWVGDGYLIRRMGIKLIGCTTTGLSKYRGLLASLKPRILLIEEAAETTEGAVLAAMYESLQQLILVGDHQQLQATCNQEHLAIAPYHLAISMFERLVNNKVGYTMLNLQRRMIPELRQLLSEFYPALRDHPSVADRITHRPHVPGMGGRDSWFFQHTWPESRDEAASRSNTWEADFICRFYEYLVFNGVEPRQITVLTFYNGQRKLISSQLRKSSRFRLEDPANIKIFTVDSYQGEENDIILLSLVRNNEEHKIGFLDNPNRAVVSLSRARRGFYIFGNAVNLLQANSKSFEIWGTVTDAILRQGRPDDLSEHLGLPVVCATHNRQTTVRDPQDFESINGGCMEPCGRALECGHVCPYKCHPFLHSDVVCTQSCPCVLSCQHGCSGRCGDACYCDICNLSTRYDTQTPPETSLHTLGHVKTQTSQTKVRLATQAGFLDDGPEKISSAQWVAACRNGTIDEPQLASTRRNAMSGKQSLNDTRGSGLTIKDIHKPVIVDDEGRKRVASSITIRKLNDVALANPSVMQLSSTHMAEEPLIRDLVASSPSTNMGAEQTEELMTFDDSLVVHVKPQILSTMVAKNPKFVDDLIDLD